MITALISAILSFFQEEMEKAELSVFLCFLLSFIFSCFVLPRILLISKSKDLYDDLDPRKCHAAKISRLGGLVFIPSVLIALSFTTGVRYLIDFPLNSALSGSVILELLFLMAGSLFLYFVGVKDDLIGVRYRKKFIAQFLVASLLPMSGLYVNNMYGLFGIYELPIMVAVPFTIVLIVFITNAVNLMDGIDGLAAGESLICFSLFGVLFFNKALWLYSMLAFALVGCLLPFLFYNIFGSASRGTKLFMGDSGSLIMGYMLSFFAIKYAMCAEGTEIDIQHFVIPFSLLFTPVFDALRVMCVRVRQSHPVFLADRNHIHHKFLDAGFSHLQATGLILGFITILLGLNIFLADMCNINLLLCIDLLLAGVLNWRLDILKSRCRKSKSN